ncbi:MAG: D-2-hydroxyacid dehydrogenase [Candidatus Poribacteria bacterium]|nr:D-2-hydroxyacid dehydrogenase [Candidatus Poribacteria bacterium]
MDKIKVLIGSRQEPEVEAMLSDVPAEAEVHFLPHGESLSVHISDVEILFGRLGEDEMSEASALRWVHQPHAGVEGFMYPAFKVSDVTLTNCRGLYGTQIAEHAFALLLSLTRQIPTQLEFMKTKHWERVPCVELAGMTMGILGLGGIGRAIATRARAFDFEVVAADVEPIDKPDTVSELYGLDELAAFLAQTNILMVCCPSTPETHKLLSHAQFNQMPDGGYIVNVSRGKVVDEDALIAVLQSGKLAGAGLDVTYTEPCPPENPLWEQENVILTSHSAGASQHIRRRAMQLFIDNLHRYVAGEPLVNVVDKQKGY